MVDVVGLREVFECRLQGCRRVGNEADRAIGAEEVGGTGEGGADELGVGERLLEDFARGGAVLRGENGPRLQIGGGKGAPTQGVFGMIMLGL